MTDKVAEDIDAAARTMGKLAEDFKNGVIDANGFYVHAHAFLLAAVQHGSALVAPIEGMEGKKANACEQLLIVAVQRLMMAQRSTGPIVIGLGELNTGRLVLETTLDHGKYKLEVKRKA